MSDFVFSTRPLGEGVLSEALRAYLAPVAAEIEEVAGPWGALAVTRRPHGPPVLHQDASGCTVVLGEPLATAPGGTPGPLHAEGRRAALHGLLLGDGAPRWDEHLDGMWAALAVGPTGVVRAVTDRFGFIPLFRAPAAEGDAVVVGSHADVVARAAGRGSDWDPVSLADQVMHLTCTFPFTHYREVLQLTPGAEHDPAPGRERGYWRPEETNPFASLDAAAEALRTALSADLRHACAGYPEAGILLSGGEDSRALLGAMPADVAVTAFTYAGAMNREARAARRAAAAYGAEFRLGVRDEAHYEAGMPTVAAMVGSLHLFMDVHGYGLHRRLGIDRLPVVVGGLSADSLLKAHYAPGVRPAPAAPGVRQELVDAVAARRAGFLAWLREIRPTTALEWTELYPFSMRRHGANVHGNRRLFAAHEAYHCNGALQVAAAAPVAWKRRRRLFIRAVRPFLRRSWYVPHARSRFPYFGAGPNLALGALLRGGRVVRDVATGQITRRQGGWPKWSEVSGSGATAEAWERFPAQESALRQVFLPALGEAEVRRSLGAVHPLRQLMALQLACLTGPGRGERDGC